MTSLTVRRLLIDLKPSFDRHWCGGDAFRSAFFNALSMSFPVGEQFFIDSLRNALAALPEDKQQEYKAQVQGFIGQEATHRRIHALFNEHLEQQGLHNAWEVRAIERMKLMQGSDPRHCLAITAATEHFTAIFAEWILQHPHALAGSETRLQTMWLWHCAEEVEHKSTAFDLYHALGGDHAWRVTWFRRITTVFLTDILKQTVNNLRRDGTLWKWRTFRSAAGFLLGKQGLIRRTYQPWRAYLRQDFHPSQQDGDLSRQWLADNAEQYVRVGAA
jgi:predicted metal-dependent hydrolase